MSNPGVVTLTKTNVCWQELKIEDNLGEAIHIHLGQIRIDLTVKEFTDLAIAVEKILDQMNELIPVDNVGWRDLNPIFLQNPKNTDIIFRLKKVYIAQIKLKDILVDSYIHLPFVGNVFMYRSVKYSRVMKALLGSNEDNDKYEQLNELFISNEQRVQQNLEDIKKNQYPVDNQYILLTADNMIIDGQHRSACLAYLYGLDYEVPVMKWIFDDEKHLFFPPRRSLYDVIMRSYIWWIKGKVSECIKLPRKCIYWLIKQKKYIQKRINMLCQNLSPISDPKRIEDIFGALNRLDIQYIKLDLNIMTLDYNADIAVFVNPEFKCAFQKCMLQLGFVQETTDVGMGGGYKYLYSLEQDCWYKNELFRVHVYYQLMCKSFFERALLPLDQYIGDMAWATKEYNDEHQCYQLSSAVNLVLNLVQCIYFEQIFKDENIKRLDQYLNEITDENLELMLRGIFFGFTKKLIALLRNRDFDGIIDEYRYFKEY